MQSVKNEVLDLIKSAPVVVFSKSYCPYCTEAKSILNKGAVQFEVRELDVISEGGDIQNALKDITG